MASDPVGQGVDGGFGVEEAMDAAWLSAGLLPSSDVSGGGAGTPGPLLSDFEDGGENRAAKRLRGSLIVVVSGSLGDGGEGWATARGDDETVDDARSDF